VIVKSDIAGQVWKIEVEVGRMVREGDVLIILEAMKMEIPVEAPVAGTVAAIYVLEGAAVREGEALVVVNAT
jgi:biotin carboxyl carrier protein